MAQPSIKVVFQMIDAALKLDPKKLVGSEGVYEFHITGNESGTYQMIIDENGGKAIEGTEKAADVTLTISDENYKDMIAGKLNPTEAFMSGKLVIDGDIGLALKLQGILNEYAPSM